MITSALIWRKYIHFHMAHIQTYTCTLYIHRHMHTCMNTHIDKYIHTYSHTYIEAKKLYNCIRGHFYLCPCLLNVWCQEQMMMLMMMMMTMTTTMMIHFYCIQLKATEPCHKSKFGKYPGDREIEHPARLIIYL